jgi:hypothetical protein
MVRLRFFEVRFGRAEVAALIAEDRQVHERGSQLVPQVGLVREVGGQLLLERQGVAVGGLRVGQPAGVAEQAAQAVVTLGQVLAEFGAGGEVGGQSLAERQGGAVCGLRVGQPAGGTEQDAQVVVAIGQALAEVGAGGEVGGQLLPER